MRILYLDCFSGISGDMTVGALCDLGISPSTFEWELAKLDIGDFHTHFERKSRNGITGMKFSVHEGATHSPDQDECRAGHPHEHSYGEAIHANQHHAKEHTHGRRFDEIMALLEESDLTEFVKEHAESIFRRIAEAEGKIHGVQPSEVAFHEVGALDSIADIVCACVGIEQLEIDRVVASPLIEGRGWVDCAHGRFPVPAPAVLEILRGIQLSQSESSVRDDHADWSCNSRGVRGKFFFDAHDESLQDWLRRWHAGIGEAAECLAHGAGRISYG